MENIINKYESVIIIKPNLKEDKQKEIENKYVEFIKRYGKLEKIENIEQKKLAYEIKGNKEGIYIIFYFKSKENFVEELEKKYKIDEDILKFIVIKTN